MKKFMSNKISYIGEPCESCGCNIRRKSTNECLRCNPSHKKSQEKIKTRQAIRRAVEEHQNRITENCYEY